MVKEVIEKLKEIKYPNLDKNIVEVKAVESVFKEGDKIVVKLNVANSNALPLIEKEIKKRIKGVEVRVRKPITYGSTQNPNNRAPYAKHILAVTSGKGGVGKSTVSTNLAIALAQRGYKVGLLDADVYGPDIPRMVGVEGERLRWGENNKIIPSENFGIKIMSVGLTTPTPDTPLVWRSSVAVSALIQFLEDVDWGELDFLVIDMPPGTGDVQLTMAQELPLTAGVLVTTPQKVALDDVSRAVMMFKDIGVPIGGVIENMSYFIAPDTKKRYEIFGSGGGELLAKHYQIPFLGKIPLEMQIRELSDQGKPPVALGGYKELYQQIVGKLLKEIKVSA